MSPDRFVGVVRLPVEPDPSPSPPDADSRRRARVVGHRRQLPREVFRGLEVAAWVGGLGLVVAMAAFVVGSGPPVPIGVWQEAVRTVMPVTVAPCIFEPCTEPTFTGEPTRLRIAAIGVESTLDPLDLDDRGMLKPPTTFVRPGWYRGGIPPGDAGPAVVAGHVDSFEGPAVFQALHTLKTGDTVEVQRGGVWIKFRVTSVERYPKDKFPTQRVYMPTPGAELRLITCGGSFDPRRRSYQDNIVVYAILAERPSSR